MRYIIDFAYDGSMFFGYQKQKGKRTVQEEIEKVLTNINNKVVRITAAGRTDKGVNALHQIAHFDLDKEINCYKLKGALNSYLPDDIYINNIEIVNNDFHARYMVKKKTYIYTISTNSFNPLQRNYCYQYGKELDVKLMKKAAKKLVGTMDFTTFASAEDKRDDKVRTIYEISIYKEDNKIIVKFVGTGFLKYQIRNMMGLLIKVGEKKQIIDEIDSLIKSKDRRKIGLTAPACGLLLYKIEY